MIWNVAKCDPKRPSSLHLHISWNLNLHTHTYSTHRHTHTHACNYVHLVSLFRLFVWVSVWVWHRLLSSATTKSDWQQINQDLAQRRTKTKSGAHTHRHTYVYPIHSIQIHIDRHIYDADSGRRVPPIWVRLRNGKWLMSAIWRICVKRQQHLRHLQQQLQLVAIVVAVAAAAATQKN